MIKNIISLHLFFLLNFVPLPLSAITMILNVVLLIIGFFTCGKEFGLKTVYTSVMLPVFLGIFENIFPNTGSITNSQELDVLCYILVVSVGLSILFNRNASSGGLDILHQFLIFPFVYNGNDLISFFHNISTNRFVNSCTTVQITNNKLPQFLFLFCNDTVSDMRYLPKK